VPTDRSIKITTTKAKIAGIAVAGGILVFAWFGIRTQIGSMLAENVTAEADGASDIIRAAADLSPFDPRPKWLDAMILRQNFILEDLERSVSRLEEATRLEPNDFRLWTELGRGYEQTERYGEAEHAFRRAVGLAPSYAAPHWQLGNFLLRQERIEEAKAELKRATETSSIYRDQVYSLAWDYFGKDPARVEELASDSADARVNLANFYAFREAAPDALRIWNTLSPEQKQYYSLLGKQMALNLYQNGDASESLSIARDIGLANGAEEETVNNGGFESFIGDPADALFGWRIFRSDSKFEALPDSQTKAEGLRSLKVAFRNYVRADLNNIAQLVTVQPGKKYRLSFKLRTDNLRSGGNPFLLVLGVKKEWVRLAASDPFPIGSNDWQQHSLEFAVPDDVEGIELRTTRANCGEDCPIAGTFWYDDFRLERIS
jgi:Flp pilus assembly protein TadD